jgi:amino acid adenylation domain-containing protein
VCAGYCSIRTPVPPPVVFIPFGRGEIEQSIPARFRSQVQTHGDRLAVKFGARAHSYQNLDRLSSQIAHAIVSKRGDVEEPVLLMLGQGDALVSAILGALKAGKIYVPQNHSSGVNAIRHVLQDCDAPLIVTDAHNRELALQVAGRSRTVLDIDQLPTDLPSTDLAIALSAERAAYIYYTSGSTGAPKGVVDCHRNILHNILRYTNSLAISAEDRLSLLQLPGFSGAVSSMFCALLNGASIFPFDLARSGSRKMADWVIAEKLTMFHSVPVVFEQLMAPGMQFPTLRVIRLEGDKALPKHLHLFRRGFDANCWLVNGLGATETGLVRQFFFNPAMPFNDDAVPIGYPVEDMDIVLLGKENRPVGSGEVGEIAVRSQYLASGYWRRGKLTGVKSSQSLQENGLTTYRTGDLGKLGRNNCLYHLGRKDFEIRIGGQRIDPSAIEAALLSFTAIRDVVVSAHTGRHGRQRLIAYIVVTDREPPAVDTLRLKLARILPAIAIPSKYVVLDSLPLDSNSKVDRRKLPAPERKRPALDTVFTGPGTALETMLINGLEQILDIDTIGINDDFYDLGGDSLAAVELALFLEETFATTIPSELFFDGISVAKIIKWRQGTKSSQTLVTLRTDGELPPLFLFHDFAGHVLDYVHLANALKDARPVYGVQRCDSPGATSAPLLLPELAARYVAEIQRIQPDGPYLLGGQCFGGLLAFEAAQQLRKSGGEVQGVILMDTAFPGSWPRRLIQRMSPRRHWRQMAGLTTPQKVRYVTLRAKNILRSAATTIVRSASWRSRQKTGFSGELHTALQRPTDAHRFAEANYHPLSYEGAVALIHAGPLHNQRVWESVVANGLTTVELPVKTEGDSIAHPTAPSHIFALVQVMDQLIIN